MVIDKTIFQTNAPSHSDVIWAKPEEDKITLHMYNRGKWVPVSGGGSDSSSDDTSSEKIIFNPNDFSSENMSIIKDAFLQKMNITAEDIQNMTEEERENLEQQLSDFIPTILTTQDHGDIVLSNLDSMVFLCEDGTIFKQDENALEYVSYFEMPSYMRYQLRPVGNNRLGAFDIVTGQDISNSKLHIITDKVYVSNTLTGSDRDLIFHIDSARLPEQESNSNTSIWFAIDTDTHWFQDNPTIIPCYYTMAVAYGPAVTENIYINKVLLQKGEAPIMPT